MISNDVYLVVNDEQSFRLYVVEQFGKMDSRMSRIETRLDGLESRLGKVEQQTTAIMIEQAEQRGALNYIHSSLSVWGSIICGVIAFVGIFAPKFWEFFSRKDKPAPEIDIDDVADKVIAIISSRYELKPKN